MFCPEENNFLKPDKPFMRVLHSRTKRGTKGEREKKEKRKKSQEKVETKT
jgi:hypothetical protein